MSDIPTLPIAHLSYSALKMFLSNPMQFKKGYILKIWDFKNSPAAVVGSAYHEALNVYYTSKSMDKGKGAGMSYLDRIKDSDIDFGKTGSREKMTKEFNQLYENYLAEETDAYGEILDLEKSITTEWSYEDIKGTLPIKAKVDMITRKNGKIFIVDHKKVSTYSDPKEENPDYVMQAMFYYFAVKEQYGEEPTKMVFIENKASKNKDGSPQLNYYVVDYASAHRYKACFAELFGAVVKEISRQDKVYLPNFSDFFSGQESWEDYTKEIITIDMPTPVKQTTARPDFKEKKYIKSSIDKHENRDLTPVEMIKEKLGEFGIAIEPQEEYKGASIIKYTFKVSRGIKMSSVKKHRDDIALALGANSVRIEAPIAGKKMVGVEIARPKEERETLEFLDYYQPQNGTLNIPIGVDVFGEIHQGDLAKMPHLLVAGTTGSGKSVFINSTIQSLTKQNNLDEMEMILIDPKKVELTSFENDPHLKIPIITEAQDALEALEYLCHIMDHRYDLLQKSQCKNIDEYNQNNIQKMKKIVLVVDEFADLMTRGLKKETEHCIVRLAQLARAAGIHMILATQRPTVDVITGNIKANMPTRIAFFLPSQVDSKTILDSSGAEELLGSGDMLYFNQNTAGFTRLQGLKI